MPVLSQHPDPFESSQKFRRRRILETDGYTAPFEVQQCALAPQQEISPPAQMEGQVLIMSGGSGQIQIGEEPETPVKAGDVALVPAHSRYRLSNAWGQEDLTYTAIWFNPAGPDAPPTPAQSIVLASPLCHPDHLAFGVLSGPHLTCDALARIRRQEGARVFTISGSDDHQSQLLVHAHHQGQEPAQVANDLSTIHQACLDGLHMLPQRWCRPLRERSGRLALSLKKMLEEGVLEVGQVQTFHDGQGRCLTGASVRGNCPHCGHETISESCDHCFLPNLGASLQSPRCALTDQSVQKRTCARLVFRLEPFLDRLRHWLSPLAKPFWLERLAEKVLLDPFPTPEFPATHPGEWGTPVPAGLPCAGQRLAPWFETALNFAYAAQESTLELEQSEWVYACSCHDAWYFLTLIPAVLMAESARQPLARALVTTRSMVGPEGLGLPAHEALAQMPADFLRLCLVSARPESEDTDLTLARMERVLNRYASPWQQWWHSLDRQFQRVEYVLPVSPKWEEFDTGIYRDLGRLWRSAHRCRQPENFSLRQQLEVVHEVARLGSLLVVGHSPLDLSCLALAVFARLAEPIIPQCAEALSRAIGMPLVHDGTLSLPRPGKQLAALSSILLLQGPQFRRWQESRKASV